MIISIMFVRVVVMMVVRMRSISFMAVVHVNDVNEAAVSQQGVRSDRWPKGHQQQCNELV